MGRAALSKRPFHDAAAHGYDVRLAGNDVTIQISRARTEARPLLLKWHASAICPRRRVYRIAEPPKTSRSGVSKKGIR